MPALCLVELAEALGAPVLDGFSRMNFPWQHPLYQSANQNAVLAQADLVVGMEMSDFWGAINRFPSRITYETRSRLKPGTKTISISRLWC